METPIYTIQQHWMENTNAFYYAATDKDKLLEEIEEIIDAVDTTDATDDEAKVICFKVDTIFPDDSLYPKAKEEYEANEPLEDEEEVY